MAIRGAIDINGGLNGDLGSEVEKAITTSIEKKGSLTVLKTNRNTSNPLGILKLIKSMRRVP